MGFNVYCVGFENSVAPILYRTKNCQGIIVYVNYGVEIFRAPTDYMTLNATLLNLI